MAKYSHIYRLILWILIGIIVILIAYSDSIAEATGVGIVGYLILVIYIGSLAYLLQRSSQKKEVINTYKLTVITKDGFVSHSITLSAKSPDDAAKLYRKMFEPGYLILDIKLVEENKVSDIIVE